MTRAPAEPRPSGPAPAATAALLAALLAACASAPVAPAPKAEPRAARSAEVAEPSPARAAKRFEEVAGAQAAGGASPTDWPAEEARWRAVLAAGELPEARYDLGVALERQGRLAEARAEYQRALAARPLRQAAVNLAVLLELEGDTRGAAAAYAQVIREYPEDGVARARLGALYQQSGQFDEAWRLSREALQREPTSATAHQTLIRVALARGDADLAWLVALRAQKVAPDDVEVAFLSGQVAARKGDEAGATAQWKRALVLSPGHRPSRLALLESAVAHERWAEVEALATALLADDPQDAPVRLTLGVAQRRLGPSGLRLRGDDRGSRRPVPLP